eukprot:scaffold118500_cov70-Phaeocystis_antarctica.AAC.4
MVGLCCSREIAEEQARIAAQSGNTYEELLAEGLRSKQDYRKAAKANRKAIALLTLSRPVPYSTSTSVTTSTSRATMWRLRSDTSRPRSARQWTRRSGQRPLQWPPSS